jgi:hypothetical protein
MESNKITVLTTNQRTLQDILTEGRRIIEETRDTTRIHIGGTQCVSRSSLLRILGEHVGRVVTDSLRLSSWMQHQNQYGDIAFADVILGAGATLPITFEVVEEGEAVGSFTVDLAKAKAAVGDPAPHRSSPQGHSGNDGWLSTRRGTRPLDGAGRRDTWADSRTQNVHTRQARPSFADAARRQLQERRPGAFLRTLATTKT